MRWAYIFSHLHRIPVQALCKADREPTRSLTSANIGPSSPIQSHSTKPSSSSSFCYFFWSIATGTNPGVRNSTHSS